MKPAVYMNNQQLRNRSTSNLSSKTSFKYSRVNVFIVKFIGTQIENLAS